MVETKRKMSYDASSCPSCHGKRYPGSKCAVCQPVAKVSSCPSCHGKHLKSSCPYCHGKGKKATEFMHSTCDACKKNKPIISSAAGMFCSRSCSKSHVASIKQDDKRRDTESLYDIFSHQPEFVPNVTFRGWYRKPGPRRDELLRFHSSFSGVTAVDSKRTNDVNIAYTLQGDKGPIVMLLPGFPLNRLELATLQAKLAPFCRTIAVDYIGTGESSMVLERESYLLKDDVEYLLEVKRRTYGEEAFHIFGCDWGGGIAIRAASKEKDVASLGLLNPTFYVTPEIEVVGQAQPLIDFKDLSVFMENVDREVLDIIRAHSSESVNHLFNKELKPGAIAAMAERVATLTGSQLQPEDSKNPDGVDLKLLSHKPVFISCNTVNHVTEAHRLPYMYGLKKYVISAILHNQEEVAQAYLDFLVGTAEAKLADVFLGYPIHPRGDELIVIQRLRKKHGLVIRTTELW